MNQFRLKLRKRFGIFAGVPADAVRISSTLDRTYSLASRDDLPIVIGQDDVTVIRNGHESAPAHLSVRGLGADGIKMNLQQGRIIFRPSRQPAFALWPGREVEFSLSPGESCVVRCELARDPYSAGAQMTT